MGDPCDSDPTFGAIEKFPIRSQYTAALRLKSIGVEGPVWIAPERAYIVSQPKRENPSLDHADYFSVKADSVVNTGNGTGNGTTM